MTIPPPPHQADMNNESLGLQNKSDSVHAGTGEGAGGTGRQAGQYRCMGSQIQLLCQRLLTSWPAWHQIVFSFG